MHVLLVTGGIGSGKTTAAEHFRNRGAELVSVDDIAKSLLQPGTRVFDEVVAEFGSDVLDDEGRIDRQALARRAFSSRDRVSHLNRIVHPAVLRKVTSLLVEMSRRQSPPGLVVLDVPLLAEAPSFAAMADTVLAIEAAADERVRRAVAAGMAEDDVRARMACQATDGERAAIADHVIFNEGTVPEFHEALDRLLNRVVGHAP